MGCLKYGIKPQYLFVPPLYDAPLLGGGQPGWAVLPSAAQVPCPGLPCRRSVPKGVSLPGPSPALSHEHLPPQTLPRLCKLSKRVLEITDDRINRACSAVMFMVVLWAISMF